MPGAQVGEQVLAQHLRDRVHDGGEVPFDEAALTPSFLKFQEPLVCGHFLAVVFVIRPWRTGSRIVAVELGKLQRGLKVELLILEVVHVVEAACGVTENGLLPQDCFPRAVLTSVFFHLGELHEEVPMHLSDLEFPEVEVYTVGAEGVLQPFCGPDVS